MGYSSLRKPSRCPLDLAEIAALKSHARRVLDPDDEKLTELARKVDGSNFRTLGLGPCAEAPDETRMETRSHLRGFMRNTVR